MFLISNGLYLILYRTHVILGVQGNVWSEYLPTYQMVEYMAYPRASAVAEIGWSSSNNRDWKSFLKRLQVQFERWRYYQVNCALHYKLT